MPNHKLAFVFTLFLIFSIARAQIAECAAIVETAVQTADEVCNDLGRNEVCYGHFKVGIEAVNTDAPVQFDEPGAVVSLSNIVALKLSAMLEPDTWGIALMKIQANLPDTLPGQNVSIVMFGDTSLQSPDETLATRSNELGTQAYYFQTGIGGTGCDETPENGMLIQTPQGAGRIALQLNEVWIELGSTIYVQSAPEDNMVVSVLEGEARVTAFDVTREIPEGGTVSIPVDSSGIAHDAPSSVVRHDETSYQSLPVQLLPDSITLQTDSVEPCTVSGATSDIPIRVGPGENRNARASLPAGESVSVVGQYTEADSRWFLIVPNSNYSEAEANRYWVKDEGLTRSGNCEDIPQADPSNIIPQTSTDDISDASDGLPRIDSVTYYGTCDSFGVAVAWSDGDGNAIRLDRMSRDSAGQPYVIETFSVSGRSGTLRLRYGSIPPGRHYNFGWILVDADGNASPENYSSTADQIQC